MISQVVEEMVVPNCFQLERWAFDIGSYQVYTNTVGPNPSLEVDVGPAFRQQQCPDYVVGACRFAWFRCLVLGYPNDSKRIASICCMYNYRIQ